MRKIFVAAAVAAFGFGGTQLAYADSSMYSDVNWSGFYLGAEGGYGWGSTKHTYAGNGANSGTSTKLSGGLIGATYGYNWQLGSWLIGLEGDMSWTGIKDSFSSTTGFCNSPARCSTDLKWLGTDRARLGYSVGHILLYGTGGFAYGDVRASLPNSGCCDQETHWRTGYTAGGGIEAMIAPQWSVKVEYDYVDLGNSVNYHLISGGAEKVLVHDNLIRVGINYLLNAPEEMPPPPPPPPPPAPPPPGKNFIVFFDFNKANLTADALAIVQDAVKTAKSGGMVKVLITGHTDTVGSHSYNQGLSERRAEAVKDEMVTEGMDGSQISTVGKSFDDPLVPTGPGVREPQNRRAVIALGDNAGM